MALVERMLSVKLLFLTLELILVGQLLGY